MGYSRPQLAGEHASAVVLCSLRMAEGVIENVEADSIHHFAFGSIVLPSQHSMVGSLQPTCVRVFQEWWSWCSSWMAPGGRDASSMPVIARPDCTNRLEGPMPLPPPPPPPPGCTSKLPLRPAPGMPLWVLNSELLASDLPGLKGVEAFCSEVVALGARRCLPLGARKFLSAASGAKALGGALVLGVPAAGVGLLVLLTPAARQGSCMSRVALHGSRHHAKKAVQTHRHFAVALAQDCIVWCAVPTVPM